MDSDAIMEKIREKLKRVCDLKGVALYSLVDRDGTMRGNLDRQIQHTSKISLDTLMLFIEKFPDLNLNWLLRDADEDVFVEQLTKIEMANKLIAEVKEELDNVKSNADEVNSMA